MTARIIDQPAHVEVGIHMLAQLVLVQHLLILEAIARPKLHPLFQLAHMSAGQTRKDVLFFQIAFDVVGADPLADNLTTFLHQTGNECGRVLPVALLDRLQTGVQPVDDLPPIAPRGAPSNPRTLNNGDLVAFFCKIKPRREPGVSGADDADIYLMITGQFRPLRRDISRGGVIA